LIVRKKSSKNVKKNFHYYIQLTRGIVFLKVIFNHDFLRGLQICFSGAADSAHLWAVSERKWLLREMGARSQSHLKAFTLKTGWVKTHADVGYVFF